MAMDDISIQTGIIAYQQGNINLAISIFSRAVTENPRSAEAWYFLSMCLGDPEKSKYCLNRAKAIDPSVAARVEEELFQPTPLPPSENPISKPVQSAAETQSNQDEERSASDPKKTKNPSQAKVVSSPGRTKVEIGMIVLIGMLAGFLLVATPAFLLISNGYFDALIPIQTPQVATVAPTLAVSSTPTRTSTYTPNPTATRASTPLPTTINQTTSAELLMEQAQNLMDLKSFESAIPIIDQAIVANPNWALLYYQRGICYLSMPDNITVQSEAISRLQSAINNFDQAISLNSPNYSNWIYYTNLGVAYWELGEMYPNRTDREPYYETALKNFQLGYALGGNDYLLILQLNRLTSLGRWDEALQLGLRLERDFNNDDSIHTNLASIYSIKGDFNNAIKEIDQVSNACSNMYDKALVYYNADKVDKAFDIIDSCIKKSPGYGGARYFMRALIYTDRGQYDLAKQDLIIGSYSTWSVFGLYDYVMGRILIHEGENQEGVHYLQLAEASFPRDGGPLLTKMQKELEKIGAKLLTSTTEPPLVITPFPTAHPRITARPTWTPEAAPEISNTQTADSISKELPENNQYIFIVDPVKGTGKVDLRASEKRSFHFQPETPFESDQVESMVLHLETSKPMQALTIEVTVWSPANKSWVNQPVSTWGDIKVNNPENYIPKMGDVYFEIKNWGSRLIYLDNISYTMKVKLKDGREIEYGLSQPLP
jgi:tetratricopeptide (TPR) repeat protein